MANICDNTFYIYTEDPNNLSYVKNFLESELKADVYDEDSEWLEASFASKWTFPEELMEEMYQNLPDKSDIYIRVLSVEYGCLYHALWVCDQEGWSEV